MKILFVCNEYPPAVTGGIGTFTRGLGEALTAEGHEVHVVGLYDVPAPVRDVVGGVRVARLPAARGRRAILANRLALWREIREVARSGEIDVIEAPDFEGGTAGLPRCSRVRLVRLHGSHRYFSAERNVLHSPLVAFFEKWALQQADAIVSVSDYTAARTRELFGLQLPISTLHNAVTVSPSHTRKSDYSETRSAVYFGTLAEKKGVLALAQAWRDFHTTHPRWTLTVIGRDTPHAGATMQANMVALLGDAASSVDFAGFMPNEAVLARLHSFDFAVLPSFSEAFALAPMEAMALGLPVIYSSMSSGPELIQDGEDGWLCDPRSLTNVHSALNRAAASAQVRERIGKNGRATVESRFAYAAFVECNLALYTSLLAQQGPTP